MRHDRTRRQAGRRQRLRGVAVALAVQVARRGIAAIARADVVVRPRHGAIRRHRHLIGVLQGQRARGIADADLEGALRHHPVVRRGVPVGEGARVQGEADRLRLPDRQRDLLEALELPGRLARAGRESDVELRHVRSRSRAGILDRGRHRHIAIEGARPRRDREVTKAEIRIREAIAEGEERRQVIGVVVAIADIQTFGVRRLVVDAGILRRGVGRYLAAAGREGHGQLARGIHVAEQHRRDGVAVFLPRIPGLHDALHLAEPRHQDGRASVEHHDGVRVGLGDRLDQLVLLIRQAEAAAIRSLGFDVVGEDDRDAGLRRQLRRLRDQRGRAGILPAQVHLAEAAILIVVDLDGDGPSGGEAHGARLRVRRLIAPVVADLGAVDQQLAAVVAGEREGIAAGRGRRQRPSPSGRPLRRVHAAGGRIAVVVEVDGGVVARQDRRAVERHVVVILPAEPIAAARSRLQRRGGYDRQRTTGTHALGVLDVHAAAGTRGDALQGGDDGRRVHVRAAATGIHRRGRRVGPDHRDGANSARAKRQDARRVLQQHRPLLGGLGGELIVRRRGDVTARRAGSGVIEEAVGEHRAQDAMGHRVDSLDPHLAVLNCRLQRVPEIRLIGHLHIESRRRRLQRGVRRAPVRHHETRKGPLALEHVVQDIRLLAGIDVVDPIV